MIKRISLVLMALVMVVSFAACGGAPATLDVESADAVINDVWSTYAEDEQFPVMGGDFSNPVDGKAGAVNMEDVENVVATLHITEDALAQVDSIAALTHAMNANTFTAAAYHLKDAAQAEAFVSSIKESIMSTQWMCGFPDKLIIYTAADYVVAVFGNAEAIETFQAKFTAVYSEKAVLSVDEALV